MAKTRTAKPRKRHTKDPVTGHRAQLKRDLMRMHRQERLIQQLAKTVEREIKRSDERLFHLARYIAQYGGFTLVPDESLRNEAFAAADAV